MTVDLALTVASWASFTLGGLVILIGALGFHRLPDFWARIHAAGMIDTLGAALILLGMMLQAGFTLVTLKLLLISVFLFIASPTASHAIANAAWVAGLRPHNLKKDDSNLIGRKKS